MSRKKDEGDAPTKKSPIKLCPKCHTPMERMRHRRKSKLRCPICDRKGEGGNTLAISKKEPREKLMGAR